MESDKTISLLIQAKSHLSIQSAAFKADDMTTSFTSWKSVSSDSQVQWSFASIMIVFSERKVHRLSSSSFPNQHLFFLVFLLPVFAVCMLKHSAICSYYGHLLFGRYSSSSGISSVKQPYLHDDEVVEAKYEAMIPFLWSIFVWKRAIRESSKSTSPMNLL